MPLLLQGDGCGTAVRLVAFVVLSLCIGVDGVPSVVCASPRGGPYFFLHARRNVAILRNDASLSFGEEQDVKLFHDFGEGQLILHGDLVRSPLRAHVHSSAVPLLRGPNALRSSPRSSQEVCGTVTAGSGFRADRVELNEPGCPSSFTELYNWELLQPQQGLRTGRRDPWLRSRCSRSCRCGQRTSPADSSR